MESAIPQNAPSQDCETIDPILEFRDVSVKFDEDEVLKGISLAVHPGETIILFGAAGSGKTVLLKTAIGLIPVSSGRVSVYGREIQDLPENDLFEVRSQIGVLFQESALFDSMTIEQNVAYPLLNQRHPSNGRASNGRPAENRTPVTSLKSARPLVREALRFVELEQTLKKVPSELSGGMRRRAAIARAIVTKPPLLLYDSPTGGLDPITAHTIMALIIKERDIDNTTSLVVTHRYQVGSLVANFRYNPDNGLLEAAPRDSAKRTRFLVLREGRIAFEGTQEQLESSTDAYVSKFVKRGD